jgi:hypothetical protein
VTSQNISALDSIQKTKTMILKIKNCAPNSDPKKEFIILEHSSNVTLGDYLLLLKKWNSNEFINYQLPNKAVSGNGQIKLYTGSSDQEQDRSNDQMTPDAAENIDNSIPDDSDDNAVCLFLNQTKSIWAQSNAEKAYLFNKNDANYMSSQDWEQS